MSLQTFYSTYTSTEVAISATLRSKIIGEISVFFCGTQPAEAQKSSFRSFCDCPGALAGFWHVLGDLYVTASEQNIPVTSLDIFCPVSTLDRPLCSLRVIFNILHSGSLDKNMSSEHTEINADAQ